MDEHTTVEEFEETQAVPLDYFEADERNSCVQKVLNNLEIPLSVELFSKNIPLSELSLLQSGSILELNKRPGDHVDLVINGKKIGEGQLVNIEGEIGVRITSLKK